MPTAQPHGGPVSQTLLRAPLYVSPALTPPAYELARLRTVLRRARVKGVEVRVALLASRGDVGDETTLWGKPGAYARVLSGELAREYGGRLLVVMPSGLGVARAGSAAPDSESVRTVQVGDGQSDLVDGAVTAVARLAAAAGRPIAVPPRRGSSSETRDRLVIVVAAAVLLVAASAIRLRRRGWHMSVRAERP